MPTWAWMECEEPIQALCSLLAGEAKENLGRGRLGFHVMTRCSFLTQTLTISPSGGAIAVAPQPSSTAGFWTRKAPWRPTEPRGTHPDRKGTEPWRQARGQPSECRGGSRATCRVSCSRRLEASSFCSCHNNVERPACLARVFSVASCHRCHVTCLVRIKGWPRVVSVQTASHGVRRSERILGQPAGWLATSAAETPRQPPRNLVSSMDGSSSTHKPAR